MCVSPIDDNTYTLSAYTLDSRDPKEKKKKMRIKRERERERVFNEEVAQTQREGEKQEKGPAMGSAGSEW